MKKLFKIFGISALVLLLILSFLLVAPFLFKDKIIELSNRELNKMLTADVDFGALRLSFIRNFPNAYIALEDLTVIGRDDFEGDTLVAFDKFSVTVDILSVIKMENIQVKSVILDKAKVYAHVLEDGRANWDIMQPTDTEEVVKEDDSEFAFRLALKRFEINNTNIVYKDEQSNMQSVIEDLNFKLRGDMTQDNVDLDMRLDIAQLSFWMGGIRYLRQANIGFVSEIAADMKNMDFTFKDNIFNINEIVLKFAGAVKMPSDDIDVDVKFASERADFKSLLSLVPAVYMQGFETLRTTGSLILDGHVQGTLSETTTPSAHLNLKVDNAMFSYPDLPKAVEKVNIAARVFYDGVVFDRTTIDVDRFDFEMSGNPFAAKLNIKTPESDMQIAAKFDGKIDFTSISDVIPLEDVTLKGLLECDLAINGRMSTLENEQYEDFQADGMLRLSNFDYESPDFPQGVKISSTQLNFNPRIVELVNFDAIIGNTDIAMNGTLENFIPFVFTDETVRGTLNLSSNRIDLNEFMSDAPTDDVAQDTVPLSVIEVPKNIDFNMRVNIGTLLFDKLTITNTVGALTVKDGAVVMQNLGMNLLQGSMTLNGQYNTQDIKAPFIDFGMDIRQFDITTAISSFSMLEEMLPNPENYVGRVSARLNLHSHLDETLSPVLNSVQSVGRLQTHSLELRNSKLFGRMADLLRNERWRTPAPGNLTINYQIHDGRFSLTDPLVMNLLQTRIEITGDQGLDQTLAYVVNATVPTSVVGAGATDVLNNIPGFSNMREFKVAGLIGGTVTEPDIKLNVSDMASTITDALRAQAEAIRDQVVETVTERVEEVRTQVNEEINRRVEQVLSEAQRQADNVRSTAASTAARVRTEANAAADRIVREAASRSVVERRAAQTLADRTRSEGETNARRVEQEGETQARNIMDAANRRADEIRRE
jgi:hypothetical protein